MQFFSLDDIVGKVPSPILEAFIRSQEKYKLAQEDFKNCQMPSEDGIQKDIPSILQRVNDAWLEWKGANTAIAQILENKWPAFNMKAN